MATFVLVHPAWFGGWCWKKVVPLLRAQGHEVHTPTLTGLGERAHLATPEVGLSTHIADVVNVMSYEDLDGVLLVGNSSGGNVITGVADRVPERIAQLVYLDAFVPSDGQGIVDMLPPDRRQAVEALVRAEGDGWLWPRFSAAPWEEIARSSWEIVDEADLAWVLPRLCPTPFGHFTEPTPVRDDADMPPRVYIRTRWPHPGFDRFAQHAQSSPGWSLLELDASHIPYVTSVEPLAATLHGLVA